MHQTPLLTLITMMVSQHKEEGGEFRERLRVTVRQLFKMLRRRILFRNREERSVGRASWCAMNRGVELIHLSSAAALQQTHIFVPR